MNWKKDSTKGVDLGNGFYAEIYDTHVDMSLKKICEETEKRQKIIIGAPRAIELLRTAQETAQNHKEIKEFLDEYDN